MAEPRKRVFISYARKDADRLAAFLRQRLEPDYDVWLDTNRIAGGASWTVEIEEAIDNCDTLLALLTSGSYVSDICRAEQLRALRAHKHVIPLLAEPGADRPLHLETANYRDFTAFPPNPEQFRQLREDIRVGGGGATLPEKFRQTYVTAPPLPRNYIERPDALASLRGMVILEEPGPSIALTALRGMGGIGKTILALALCHDKAVQDAFPDGIAWVTIGKDVADRTARMQEIRRALGDEPGGAETETHCTNRYRTLLAGKAALVIVDDIWRTADIEPFLAESRRSRLLFTTRDSRIAAATGASEHVADLLTPEQARALLARWAGCAPEVLPPDAADLIRECGRLPLALSMIGAMLRAKPPAFWGRVLGLLRQANLAKIRAEFPFYPHADMLRAIQVSVDALDASARRRYVALAVLLDDMPAAPAVQQTLWGVDAGEALEAAEQFVGLSLAQRDGDRGGIRLHDLQLDYVRAHHPCRPALELIHGAVRLSSHVIERDPDQFAPQVLGRLLPWCEDPAILRFTGEIAAAAPRPWLRPLHPALHPPGTALIRTLEGHSDLVTGVAVTADGKRAVSASWDKTLMVWDLESGQPVAAFSCDADVTCCATAGSRMVVSGDAGGRVHFLVIEERSAPQTREQVV